MWFWDYKSGHNFQQAQTIVQPGILLLPIFSYLRFNWWAMIRTIVVMEGDHCLWNMPCVISGMTDNTWCFSSFGLWADLVAITLCRLRSVLTLRPAVFALQDRWIVRLEFMPFRTIRRALGWLLVKQTRLSNFGKKTIQPHQKLIRSTLGRPRTCGGSDRVPPI